MKMEMQAVNSPVIKVDARALVTGKPVYTDDLAPKDSLIVKVLRSPHAHALIKAIDVKAASEVDGIACVLTYEDVPDKRFTMAGQTYPEPSPYDRLILDRRMRFVGDAAAVVAGETEEAVDHALRLIKVEYEVLEPVLDFRQAKDHEILVHPEENWKSLCPVGADNKRNLCAHDSCEEGDIEALRGLIQAHAEATGSPKAGRILANFGAWLPKFKKILPHDYDRMLRTIAWYEAQGMGRVQAETEAFYVNARGKGD